jgi:ATP-dependent helicase/nuclease subunit B
LPQIKREFLGWDRPALAEAVSRLDRGYRRGQGLDLSKVIVVVPGQRAGRRLRELLAYHTEDKKLRLTPPEVITEGKLPEKLYAPKLLFANDLVQDLAWEHALRELPAEERRQLVPRDPEPADAVRWLQLGQLFRKLHRELAADGVHFPQVNQAATRFADFTETGRWRALEALQERYLALLDRVELWDMQTARIKAIEFREIQTECDIILLGTVDLNQTLRRMLAEIAAKVTAFVVAPEPLADHFDSLGCLVVDKWCQATIPFADKQLRQVDGPVEQAEGVTEWLIKLDGRLAVDEVAIGVPDESLVPQIQRELEQRGVAARWVEGMRIGGTAPYRVLAAAMRFAERRRFEDFAGLIRHPDVENWLGNIASGKSLATQLDTFYNAHLPSRIRSSQISDHRKWPDLPRATERIEGWLVEAGKNHPLREWSGILRKVLGTIYGERNLNVDDPADEVLERTLKRILEECECLDSVPESLDSAVVGAADAFQIALGSLATQALPSAAAPAAIEILGWLELPLDDSKALLVTSFNEGFVPQAAGADAFLPDRLRRELGVMHNERRYARDAYATTVLCHGGRELRVLFARRDGKEDPLIPSRLLFAAPDDTIVRRAGQFFGKKPQMARRRLLLAGEGIPASSQFKVPRPAKQKHKLEQIPVTQFKSYLACPYRYYLTHVRRLEEIDDSSRELEGSAFGILIHEALSALGQAENPLFQIVTEDQIREFLEDVLQTQVRKRYGAKERRPTVRLQIEQARLRLRSFARKQAECIQEGWQIVYAERADDRASRLCVPFPVNGESISLVGRIDRIDYHPEKRILRILDYKTADKGLKPEKTHRHQDQWIDLQLPLYRHLWQVLKLDVPEDCKIELGYFNLPRNVEATGIALAAWSEEMLLHGADETAREVIERIWAEDFANVTRPPPLFNERFAAICLDNMIGAPLLSDDEEVGA